MFTLRLHFKNFFPTRLSPDDTDPGRRHAEMFGDSLDGCRVRLTIRRRFVNGYD